MRKLKHAASISHNEATIAQAYGGLATVAQEAGVTRGALYRALSPVYTYVIMLLRVSNKL